MNQPAGKKPIPLILFRNGRGIKNQVINYFLIVECCKRNDAGYDNNDKCDGELIHAIVLKFRIVNIKPRFLFVMIFFIPHDCACPVNLFSKYQTYQLMRKSKL